MSTSTQSKMLVKSLPIDQIEIGDRCRKDLGDIAALAASIENVGLLHPVVVNSAMKLVAGERRLRAARSLGWQTVPVNVAATLDDAVRFIEAETDENACRLALSPSEAQEQQEKREVLFRPQGEAAQKSQGERGKEGGRGKKKTPRGNAPRGSGTASKQDDTKRSAERAAAGTGYSRRTLARVKEIKEAAKQEPEKYGELAKLLEKRDCNVNGIYKRFKNMQAVEQIKVQPPPLPEGPFSVIVVDPPWTYDNRADDATHRAANPYPSMSLGEIQDLPIDSIAHEDCILWLWTTNAHMKNAFSLLDTWGFQCKTILTWVKDKFGTGDWLRGQTEHCLLAVRGEPVVDKSVAAKSSTFLQAPSGKHSSKPDAFYVLVEALCPGTKLEFFARRSREGWVQHGNEI